MSNVLLSPHKVSSIRKRIWDWYKKHKRSQLPWRKTTDPYKILVSEIMLQQTQVDRVIPKFEAFIKVFPTVQKLAHSSQKDVLTLWSGLGYNNRALRLRKAAQAIVEKFKGKVPKRYEDLLALPGIGDYTARAILAFAFNQDVVTVDTNIRRIIIHECKLSEKTSHEELLHVAEQLLQMGKSCEWHSALMDYGAVYLTSKKANIAPTSRQGKFLHSPRWYRGRILKMLLEKGEVNVNQLKELFEKEEDFLMSIIMKMESEGIVVVKQTRSKKLLCIIE